MKQILIPGSVAAALCILAVIQTLATTSYSSRPLRESERFSLAWRLTFGWLGRDVFWLGLVYIVGHAVYASYKANETGMVIVKLIFFPAAYLIYPWISGLWWILALSLVGYWVSTFIGRLEPVE